MSWLSNFLRSRTTQNVAGAALVSAAVSQIVVDRVALAVPAIPWDFGQPTVKSATIAFLAAMLTAGIGRTVAFIRTPAKRQRSP